MTAPVPPSGSPAPGSPAAGSPAAAAFSPRAGVVAAAAPRLAALLLGAACVAWTATPLRHTGLAGTALVVAIVAVTAGALRLALADVPQLEESQREAFYLPAPIRMWLAFLALLRLLPWEEIALVALIWLEVLHPARPWHTAALGAALVAYLLTVHIAESGAEPRRLLRRQAKVLIAGASLIALGAGFATLPAAAPGAGSALLRVLAAIAVIAAAALALPALPPPRAKLGPHSEPVTWSRRFDRPGPARPRGLPGPRPACAHQAVRAADRGRDRRGSLGRVRALLAEAIDRIGSPDGRPQLSVLVVYR